MYKSWIVGIETFQCSLYIPNISFPFCYNERFIISKKIFIKNKRLKLPLTTIEMKNVMLNFLWIKGIIIMIQMVNKGKAPFELLDCSWHAIDKVSTCRVELMCHRSGFTYIGVINI